MDRGLILNKLQDYKKIRRRADFADFLGISPQLLNDWLRRNFYNTEVLIKKFPEINISWLLTGEGEMLKSGAKAPVKVSLSAPTAQPASAPVQSDIIKMYESIIAQKDEQLRIKDEQISKLLDILGRK